MPISCSNNEKPRYRVKSTSKGKIRLAFCKNKVVEAKKLSEKVNSKKYLGSKR